MLVCVVLSCLFLAALWSPAGKGFLSCVLCFVTFPNMSWSTLELRARLAPWNWFKPSSKIFLLTVPRRYFFCGSFMFFSVLCFSCFCVCSLLPCGHMLGMGWPLPSRHTSLNHHRFNVDSTPWRWINIESMLIQGCVSAGSALVGDVYCILLLSHVVSWSGVVLDCIVSWFLPPFILL